MERRYFSKFQLISTHEINPKTVFRHKGNVSEIYPTRHSTSHLFTLDTIITRKIGFLMRSQFLPFPCPIGDSLPVQLYLFQATVVGSKNMYIAGLIVVGTSWLVDAALRREPNIFLRSCLLKRRGRSKQFEAAFSSSR
jgi:hypothetical protein